METKSIKTRNGMYLLRPNHPTRRSRCGNKRQVTAPKSGSRTCATAAKCLRPSANPTLHGAAPRPTTWAALGVKTTRAPSRRACGPEYPATTAAHSGPLVVAWVPDRPAWAELWQLPPVRRARQSARGCQRATAYGVDQSPKSPNGSARPQWDPVRPVGVTCGRLVWAWRSWADPRDLRPCRLPAWCKDQQPSRTGLALRTRPAPTSGAAPVAWEHRRRKWSRADGTSTSRRQRRSVRCRCPTSTTVPQCGAIRSCNKARCRAGRTCPIRTSLVVGCSKRDRRPAAVCHQVPQWSRRCRGLSPATDRGPKAVAKAVRTETWCGWTTSRSAAPPGTNRRKRRRRGLRPAPNLKRRPLRAGVERPTTVALLGASRRSRVPSRWPKKWSGPANNSKSSQRWDSSATTSRTFCGPATWSWRTLWRCYARVGAWPWSRPGIVPTRTTTAPTTIRWVTTPRPIRPANASTRVSRCRSSIRAAAAVLITYLTIPIPLSDLIPIRRSKYFNSSNRRRFRLRWERQPKNGWLDLVFSRCSFVLTILNFAKFSPHFSRSSPGEPVTDGSTQHAARS